MAGATNRAFKAAGIPKAAQKEIRVMGGRGLTLRSAISLAGERGIQIPQKAHDFLAKRDAKSAQKAKSVDDGAEQQRRDAARAEARDVYARGNAGSRAKLAGMRGQIRELVGDVRAAKRVYDNVTSEVRSDAMSNAPKAKGGRDKRKNERARDSAIDSAVANHPRVRDAARFLASNRSALQSALASRDATARARKQQRGAESGGQMDLFSGAPTPRAASPFERKVALRNARAAQGAAQMGRVGATMMQQRKTAGAKARAAAVAKAEARIARTPRTVADVSRGMMASRKATAARDARRAAVAANPRQRGEADYRRVLQKASASANEAYNVAKARPTTENERRSSQRQDRLMRVLNMTMGKVDTKALGKNPYERPAQESVAKHDRREKARERAKREKRAAADAARRSHDFWYR